MGKNEGIRVTVRFRPMNKRENTEDNNKVCVKISPCGRACQVENPDTPQKPRTYFFDTIYGPASNQAEVYQYSGAPLVEAMKEGYNSTIFAYGQTGSGKTWSMMGALGTENRGIQPRIIENVFDHVENLPEDCQDEYTVQISMCEIYLERIKDLFNPIQDDLKVRESPENGIYVAGLTEQYCASVQEVLDAMENGMMSRATSKTSMNNESSRSHCVTILKVTRRKPNGTTMVSKIKMVDLAGSEKTRKTEAVGMRLKEAQCINQSLTSLSQVLNALTKGDAKTHIPYRNSKLTRLLEDALGGNSKTSLIVAASPCSFNVEETISSLRFGERAKKVKCKAVINQVLSLEEYKKQLAKLQKEVEALTYDNELLKAREAALFEFMRANGHDPEVVVRDVRIGEEEEKDQDLGNLEFNKVSDQMLVINKRTGRVEAGDVSALEADGLSSSGRKKSADARRKAMEKAENERIATLAAAMIRRGDYKGLTTVLEGKVAIGGGVSQQAADDMEDQLADFKAELRGADSLNEQLDDELEAVLDRNQDLMHDLEAVKARLAEHRFYKQKVEFLEKESEMQYKRLKDQERMIDFDDAVSDINLDFLADVPAHIRDRVQQLANTVGRKDAMIKRLKEAGTFNSDELIDALTNGSGNQADALKKILTAHKTASAKLRESEKTAEKAKRQAAMLIKRDVFNKQLQDNWKTQLRQMEQAILLCSTIHKRDRAQYASELKLKDNQIEKLKTYLEKVHQLRSKPANKTIFGAGGKMITMRKPRKNSTGKKKRRPSKVVRSEREQNSIQSRA